MHLIYLKAQNQKWLKEGPDKKYSTNMRIISSVSSLELIMLYDSNKIIDQYPELCKSVFWH